ncbi:SGNH/GDSL hydrolase family protein [uncultured Lentibacter sp.]|uniref:SGNH/GDSL hydrolase family protein n=1 Tax=uncultured Lentibacter sp. TaxID=1659309 RepID=UPI0026028FD4|nr:SGNH/GDSL hydrolase family protein [uncultured Lentibacter sp.]
MVLRVFLKGVLVWWLAASATLAQTATQTTPSTDAPRILAIGDSLVAWHRNEGVSIADSLSAALGEPVLNRAIAGARMINALPLTGAIGLRIPSQFRPRQGAPYDWVIVSGGGNDFLFGCGCRRCERRMNRLITENTDDGEVANLISQIRETGAKVVYLGYLRSPGVASPIERCKDEGDTFEARLALLAARTEGVYFHSVADLVPFGDRSFHGVDMIHPSKKASMIIGQQISDLIRQEDGARAP